MNIIADKKSESNRQNFFSNHKEEIIIAGLVMTVALVAIGIGLIMSAKTGIQATEVQTQDLAAYRDAIKTHQLIWHSFPTNTSQPKYLEYWMMDDPRGPNRGYPLIPTLSEQMSEFKNMGYAGGALILMGGLGAAALGYMLYNLKKQSTETRQKLAKKIKKDPLQMSQDLVRILCLVGGIALVSLAVGYIIGGAVGTHAMAHSPYNALFSNKELFQNNWLATQDPKRLFIPLPTLDQAQQDVAMASKQFADLTTTGVKLLDCGILALAVASLSTIPLKKRKPRAKVSEWIEMKTIGS